MIRVALRTGPPERCAWRGLVGRTA